MIVKVMEGVRGGKALISGLDEMKIFYPGRQTPVEVIAEFDELTQAIETDTPVEDVGRSVVFIPSPEYVRICSLSGIEEVRFLRETFLSFIS